MYSGIPHCLPIPIICHSPLFVIPHCMLVSIVFHIPMSVIPHCLSFPMLCHSSLSAIYYCLSLSFIWYSTLSLILNYLFRTIDHLFCLELYNGPFCSICTMDDFICLGQTLGLLRTMDHCICLEWTLGFCCLSFPLYVFWYSPLSTNSHCVSFPVCHFPLYVIHYCLSLTIVCLHPSYGIPHCLSFWKVRCICILCVSHDLWWSIRMQHLNRWTHRIDRYMQKLRKNTHFIGNWVK